MVVMTVFSFLYDGTAAVITGATGLSMVWIKQWCGSKNLDMKIKIFGSSPTNALAKDRTQRFAKADLFN
jgi:hypothetical protein